MSEDWRTSRDVRSKRKAEREKKKEGKKGRELQKRKKRWKGMMRRRVSRRRGWGKEILRHVTALFSDFITVLANLISERRHNITIYEWERKGIHGNGHIYYELRPRAFRTQPALWALSTCHYVKYIRYVQNFELFSSSNLLSFCSSNGAFYRWDLRMLGQ